MDLSSAAWMDLPSAAWAVPGTGILALRLGWRVLEAPQVGVVPLLVEEGAAVVVLHNNIVLNVLPTTCNIHAYCIIFSNFFIHFSDILVISIIGR